MNYEELLDYAYKDVQSSEGLCDRFEILPVKGHHEGIRTIITNFMQVASCIRRNPEHLMKYLTKELASQVEIRGDRLILSRKLSSKNVNDKIEKYVNIFVICPNCKKPDTELDSESERLFVRCLACGNKQEVHRI